FDEKRLGGIQDSQPAIQTPRFTGGGSFDQCIIHIQTIISLENGFFRSPVMYIILPGGATNFAAHQFLAVPASGIYSDDAAPIGATQGRVRGIAAGRLRSRSSPCPASAGSACHNGPATADR